MENPLRSASHEEGLRYAGIAAVIGLGTRISLTASRHLQLCAGQSGVTSFLLRQWRTADEKVFAGALDTTPVENAETSSPCLYWGRF
jgi:hypothetical protein